MALKQGKKRLLVNLDPDIALFVEAAALVSGRSQSRWINDSIRSRLLHARCEESTRILVTLEELMIDSSEHRKIIEKSEFIQLYEQEAKKFVKLAEANEKNTLDKDIHMLFARLKLIRKHWF